jgi:hypothetical protein
LKQDKEIGPGRYNHSSTFNQTQTSSTKTFPKANRAVDVRQWDTSFRRDAIRHAGNHTLLRVKI